MQLTDAERQRIVAAIREAETHTSGEIYCVLMHAASPYRLIPVAWAALVALAVPLPLIYGTNWSASAIYFLQLVAFAAVGFGLSSHRVRYFIVPRRVKRERAHAAALRQFAARGLQHTEKRTGVLIFVAVAERYAEILADAGINQKVGNEVWDTAVADLIKGIKADSPVNGFVAAIEQCANVLGQHFPPGAINRDELPNAIIEL